MNLISDSEALGYMARVVEGSHSFTAHVYPRVYPRMKRIIAAFAFLAEAGPHLPASERWKAELI